MLQVSGNSAGLSEFTTDGAELALLDCSVDCGWNYQIIINVSNALQLAGRFWCGCSGEEHGWGQPKNKAQGV